MHDNRSVRASRTAVTTVAQGAREKLLLLFFCLFSLACAAYFLARLKPAQAASNNHASPPSTVAAKGAIVNSPLGPGGVSEVVAKALAFKAMLNATQQATLEQAYTTTLARRWSNLPCGSSCRNGIQLGSLNA